MVWIGLANGGGSALNIIDLETPIAINKKLQFFISFT